VFVESDDDEQIIERVAALDIGKAEIVCCIRLPATDGGKQRVQEVSHIDLEIGWGYVKQVDIVGDDRWTRRQRHRAD
jgi:hypothetical protein